MAYMFAINTSCQHDGCRKPATHRVCKQTNDTIGTFCKKHALVRLASLEAAETRNSHGRPAGTGDQP